MARLRHIVLMLSGAAMVAGAICMHEPARNPEQMRSRQPASETIERGAEKEEKQKRLRMRIGLGHMKRSLRVSEEASSALSRIGNTDKSADEAGLMAGYEGQLAGSEHDVELVPADELELESAISEAMLRRDMDSLEKLAALIPQTLSIGAQSRAYLAIESLALEGNPGAAIALAQTAPFLIDEETRRNALDNLEIVLEDSEGQTRKSILDVLSFHLQAGPLAHWSLSGDRARVLDLLSRFE